MTSVPGVVSVKVGAEVFTADAKKLGVVKETLTDRFKIDVRWAPDYWLGTEVVETASDSLVQLFITKAGVGAAKIRNRGVDGSGVPSAQ